MFKKFDDVGDVGVVLKKPESDERRMLLRAAAILEEYGWCQGQLMKRPSGPQRLRGMKEQYCAWGALYAADCCAKGCLMGTSPEVHRVVNALERAFGSWCGLAEWNDQPGRTKAEVVALMRSVAATL